MAISAEKKKGLSNVLAQMNKRFGAGVVALAKDKEDELKTEFIRTPSHEFNAMLGGGFAKGRIVELYGENSSGKTTMLIETIAKNQKENPDFTAAWFETEGSIDQQTLEMFNVDLERLVFWNQDDVGAEQGLDILRGLVGSGEFDLVVINSVAGLAPKKEIEDDIEKQNVALTARIMSKLMRVLTGSAFKTKTCVAFVNQTRVNVGQMFGDPTTTTGGKALAFFATTRVHMRRAKVMAGDPIKEENGLKICCRVIKNRLAKKNPFTTCEYFAIYGEGIDTLTELPAMLEREGIMRKSGSWYYWEDENGNVINFKGLECKFKSKAILVDALRDNPELADQLSKMLDEIITTGKVTQFSLSDEEIGEIKRLEAELNESAEELGLEDHNQEELEAIA